VCCYNDYTNFGPTSTWFCGDRWSARWYSDFETATLKPVSTEGHFSHAPQCPAV
jgi:hypothetical protein